MFSILYFSLFTPSLQATTSYIVVARRYCLFIDIRYYYSIVNKKTYVFIAGGIGITPFRSMIKDLVDREQKVAITLFYQARDVSELLFGELFAEAKETIGLQTVYLLQNPPKNWPFETGHVTQKLLEKYVPEYLSSLYYISGPQSMIASYNGLLESLAISSEQVKTDLFTGYA